MIKPPIFDVSGVHGASGISGKDRGHCVAHTTDDGLNGGNGTGGQDGTSAGTILVRLTTPTTTANIPKNVVLANPIDVDVMLDASTQAAGQLQKMYTVVKINSWESMSFLAVGGNGGQGGNGGDGESGCPGYRYGAFPFILLQ